MHYLYTGNGKFEWRKFTVDSDPVNQKPHKSGLWLNNSDDKGGALCEVLTPLCVHEIETNQGGDCCYTHTAAVAF
jgi:hypothetical protein